MQALQPLDYSTTHHLLTIAASPRLVTALALAPTPARNGPQHILTSPPRARNMPLPASSPALLSFRKQHLLVELYVARP
jgi:hypothetical protein